MYYVVIDLEWNQYHNPLRTPTSRSGVKMHEEIIQIGAIKTDHKMNPVDTFSLYVRLGGGRRLDRYVRKLTHISDHDIACGEDLSVAAPEFADWLKDVDAIFSWGPDDRRVFLNNLAFYDLPAPACAWYDAQKIYASQVPEHGGLALKSVAEAMNVHVNLTLHDAMNDAILTAFCMAKLDMEAGVKEYAHRPAADESGKCAPQPIHTAKTHRHVNQQAAWEEACNGLLRCPECMQNLEWTGDEKGTLARWYKTARCETHGEYVVRGEFNGEKMYSIKLSFFKPTPEVLEMVKQETEPAETSPKRRRRRRRKKTNADESAQAALAPDELLVRAIAFAAEAHKSQTRKGGNIPYIVHPMEASAIVATMTDDPALIAAAVLHDTVEDCEGVTVETIEKTFGSHVAELVAFESQIKDPGMSWRESRQEFIDRLKTADEEHLILTLGDKLSNMRAISRDYAVMKNELWKRFSNSDKREYAWYYRSLAESLQPISGFDACQEFARLVKSVFGTPRLAKKVSEKQPN